MEQVANKRDFEWFYGIHFDKVYRFVFFRVSGNKETAEDLVSEIFMKALKSFADYDVKKSTSAWIMTIAKNHLANHWRDTKKTEPLPEDQDDENFKNDSLWFSSALKQWQKDESAREVYELLEKISAPEQELVTYHYLLGYSYAEIAELKGLTEGAVKVASHRAVKKLRTFL